MLNSKQMMFCREYLLDLNGAAAARRAGYSAKTADQLAYKLLQKPEVQQEIQRLTAERARTLRIDADGLLKRLVDEANADIADLFKDDGSLRPAHEWPLAWRRGLVAGIEVEQLLEGSGEDRKRVGTVAKVRLSDRIKRLELIGKHVGVNAFKDKVQVEVSDPLAQLLKDIGGRSFGPKEQK